MESLLKRERLGDIKVNLVGDQRLILGFWAMRFLSIKFLVRAMRDGSGR